MGELSYWLHMPILTKIGHLTKISPFNLPLSLLSRKSAASSRAAIDISLLGEWKNQTNCLSSWQDYWCLNAINRFRFRGESCEMPKWDFTFVTERNKVLWLGPFEAVLFIPQNERQVARTTNITRSKKVQSTPTPNQTKPSGVRDSTERGEGRM